MAAASYLLRDLSIALAEVEETKLQRGMAPDPDLKAAKSAIKRTIGNLPADLPRIVQVIEPDSLICPCGCGEMHKIGGGPKSSGWTSCPPRCASSSRCAQNMPTAPDTDGVVQAQAPAHLVTGGLPTEATIAHVLVSKYADHLPLYRQSQILARGGLDLHCAVLTDWVGKAAFHLAPIVERIAQELKGSTKLFMDESTAPVLDPGRGATKTGYLWALARDDRAWGGEDPPDEVCTSCPRPIRRSWRSLSCRLQRYPAHRRLHRLQPPHQSYVQGR